MMFIYAMRYSISIVGLEVNMCYSFYPKTNAQT